MFALLFKTKPNASQTKADKMAMAMSHLDTQIAAYEETSTMQNEMAQAYKTRAAAALETNDKKAAVRLLRRAVACENQVNHIETVISSTAGQRHALELSAVHSASANAAEMTRSALSQQTFTADSMSDALNDISEIVDNVQSTQDAISAFSEGASIETDEELLAQFQTDVKVPTLKKSTPDPPLPVVLPVPPVHDPVLEKPKLSKLLQFTPA